MIDVNEVDGELIINIFESVRNRTYLAHHDCEEATQTAMLKLLEKAAELEPGPVGGWLRSSAFFAAMNLSSKAKRLQADSLDWLNDERIESTGEHPVMACHLTPERILLAREELFDRLASSVPVVPEGVTPPQRHPVGERVKRPYAWWTRERVIAALREWTAAEGRTPLSRDSKRDPALPSENTVRKVIGTWNEGLEAAGLPTRPKHIMATA